RDEWHCFLQVLTKKGPRRPLHGIVVAISAAELLGRRDELRQRADKIRDRIDDVRERSRITLPVYVLVAKLDLIPGFSETFKRMPAEAREQIWGATVPGSLSFQAALQRIARSLHKLEQSTETSVLKRLGPAVPLEDREGVYSFPQQLGVLRERTLEFVERLFHENAFQEPPRMRGVYFTSATQDGRPIDRIRGQIAGTLGIAEYRPPRGRSSQEIFFLRDLFLKVVFSDFHSLVYTPTEQRRQRRVRHAILGSIVGVALCVSCLSLFSYGRNMHLLTRVDQVLQGSSTLVPAQSALQPQAFQPLLSLMREFDTASLLSSTTGMHAKNEVAPHIRGYFARLYRRAVLLPLLEGEMAYLNAFSQRTSAQYARISALEYWSVYERLRFYLLLTLSKATEVETILDAHQRWLSAVITQKWSLAVRVPEQERRLQPMQSAVRSYLRIYKHAPQLGFARHAAAVDAVRNALFDVPFAEVALSQIISELDGKGYDLSLTRLLGGAPTSVQASQSIRGAFTRRAYEEKVRELLVEPVERFRGDCWVLGERCFDQEQRFDQVALRRAYFSGYVAEWDRFITSIRSVSAPTDMRRYQGLAEIVRGSPSSSIYGKIFRQLYYHTHLVPIETDRQATSPGNRRRETVLKKSFPSRASRYPAGAAELFPSRLKTTGFAGEETAALESLDAPLAVSEQDVRRHFERFIEFGFEGPSAPESRPETPLRLWEESLSYVIEAYRTDRQRIPHALARAAALTDSLTQQVSLDRHKKAIRSMLLPILSLQGEGGALASTEEDQSAMEGPAQLPAEEGQAAMEGLAL
ncbi:MAG: type VI secretion protein IcmF/TssM N-terminal domain-containing protein, partial [Myxococcota bacterium]